LDPDQGADVGGGGKRAGGIEGVMTNGFDGHIRHFGIPDHILCRNRLNKGGKVGRRSLEECKLQKFVP